MEEAKTSKLIFINGPMGVGKTAVSVTLQKSIPHCGYLKGDDCWQWCENPSEEQKCEVYDTVATRLTALLEKNDVVIFDWVMHESEIVDEILVRLWCDFDFLLVTLLASPEILSARIRKDGGDEAKIRRSLERLQHYSHMDSYKIDTTSLGIDEVTEMIKEII